MNDALKPLIRPHYLSLQGYISAGMESDKTADKIFMNANENPFVLPGTEGLNRYPEPQPEALLEGYASLYDVSPDQIVATRGADEAIVVLTHLFCEPHKDAIIICPPTFGMYARDAHTIPAEIFEVPLLKTENGSFNLDEQKIVECAKEPDNNVKLVFLCSPNNPTGTSFDRELMIRICKELEGHAAVIIDETYIEFATQGSMSAYIEEVPNLIILRTLSKSYALAGARMGCLIAADKDFINIIRSKCLDAYPLPIPSVKAALTVMGGSNLKQAEKNRTKLLAERDRLQKAFSDSELVRHIYPSDANFLLIEMNGAKDFIELCMLENIILRDFTAKPGTKNCIRISPGLPKENDKLITLLKKFEASRQSAA